jgi:hypothetical protein
MKIFKEDMKRGLPQLNLPDGLVWVKDYEPYYAVDKEGIIYSCGYHNKPRPMKPQFLNSGYRIITFSYPNRKRKSILVGKIILSSFVPEPTTKGPWFVSYRDFNKLNTKLENLYWADREEIYRKLQHPVDLFKDGETIHFESINEARLFLKQSWSKELRQASEEETLIKGYKVKTFLPLKKLYALTHANTNR